MILRGRAARLPSALRARLPDGPPLAAAELADETWAVVTAAELVILGEDGPPVRHPWHVIEHGQWDGDARTFTITWIDGATDPLVLRTASDAVATFTAALRERVQASVVHTDATETPGGARIRVYIRRDGTGALLSQVQVTGTLTGDPAEQAVIDDVERRARAAVGLPT